MNMIKKFIANRKNWNYSGLHSPGNCIEIIDKAYIVGCMKLGKFASTKTLGEVILWSIFMKTDKKILMIYLSKCLYKFYIKVKKLLCSYKSTLACMGEEKGNYFKLTYILEIVVELFASWMPSSSGFISLFTFCDHFHMLIISVKYL